jgi:hypothetical protein
MNIKKYIGKRFLFGMIAMICVTVATVARGFDGDVYFKLVSCIVGAYLASQTVTDYKGGNNETI